MALSGRHRDTLDKLFEHPSSGNVEWRELRSLLESLGTVVEEANGKLRVTVGSETDVVVPPRLKDVDPQLMVDLRRLLRDAGFEPGAAAG